MSREERGSRTKIICYYGTVPLIQHPWDWTGARLSNILDYQTVLMLTYVLTGNFLLLPSENVHLSVLLTSS